jgi:hypothetical protein
MGQAHRILPQVSTLVKQTLANHANSTYHRALETLSLRNLSVLRVSAVEWVERGGHRRDAEDAEVAQRKLECRWTLSMCY